VRARPGEEKLAWPRSGFGRFGVQVLLRSEDLESLDDAVMAARSSFEQERLTGAVEVHLTVRLVSRGTNSPARLPGAEERRSGG
jgi:hypothetical protein